MSSVTPLNLTSAPQLSVAARDAILPSTTRDVIAACVERDRVLARAKLPGGAALNLSGNYRCPLPLPPPEAAARAPSASDANGVVAWAYAKLTNTSNVPFAPVKKRIFATLGGLDNVIRAFAPAELDSYRRLLAKTVGETDEAALGVEEQQLRALKTRFAGEVKGVLDQERANANLLGETFDRLAVLKSKGLVWPGWTSPRPGQAALAEVPADNWRDERTGLLSQRIPFEAELILDTALPIAVGNPSYGVTFLRGEAFGSKRSLASAVADFERLSAEAQAAAARRSELEAGLIDATKRSATAVTRAATGLAEFRKTEPNVPAATNALVLATRNAEEAQKLAAAAETSERAPITQLEADLQLLMGSNLVINFASGRAEILPSSKPALDDLVTKLQSSNIADLPATIEGHTDSRGNPAKNQELSERRAAAVRDYLIAAGVVGSRLEALGMGQRQPLDPAHPEADKNRRVRVSVAIPPDRENALRARLAEAQQAYAASMETHQRAVADALAAVVVAAKGQEDAIAARKSARVTAIDAETDRVATSNALRKTQRDSVKADKAAEKAESALREAQAWLDRSRSRSQGFFSINFVDTRNVWDRTPPPQLAERVSQALLGPQAEQTFGELFDQARPADRKRLATAVGEILSDQETKKSSDRVRGERIDTMWALWLGEAARPRGQFVNVAGTFGPQETQPSPYRGASIPLPDNVTPPAEVVVPIEIVTAPPAQKPDEQKPQEPKPDDELSLEDTPSTGDTAPPPPPAAAAPPPGEASPREESDLWMPNLPEMSVGPAGKPVAPKPGEFPVQVYIVAGPKQTQEPPDEVLVLDKDLAAPDTVALDVPDTMALAAEAEAAKARSDAAAAQAAAALSAARAARDRVGTGNGDGAAIQSSVARRGGSTSVRLDIQFGLDSDVITDTSSLESLVPKLLSDEFRGRRILIGGYTDKTGSDDHNQALSLRRAQSVRNQFVRRGVPSEVIVIRGYGAKNPIPGTSPTDPTNRRVVISVMPLEQ